MIFQRRTGHDDLKTGLQIHRSLRTAGGDIFNPLGFVEHDGTELNLCQHLGYLLLLQQAVTTNQQIERL